MPRLALYLCVSVQAHHHYINPFTCLLAYSCVAATAFTRMLYPPLSAAFPTLLPLFTIFDHLLPSIYAQHALAPALLVVASPTAHSHTCLYVRLLAHAAPSIGRLSPPQTRRTCASLPRPRRPHRFRIHGAPSCKTIVSTYALPHAPAFRFALVPVLELVLGASAPSFEKPARGHAHVCLLSVYHASLSLTYCSPCSRVATLCVSPAEPFDSMRPLPSHLMILLIRVFQSVISMRTNPHC